MLRLAFFRITVISMVTCTLKVHFFRILNVQVKIAGALNQEFPTEFLHI